MADIKTKYPATGSTALTISLASLASGSAGVYTSGRQSDAVDNTTNLDIDHLVSGKIRVGTSPTSGRVINVYAWANISSASGTPSYPDTLTGSDAPRSFTSANVMNSIVRLVASITIDSTSDRDYFFGPVSIASLFVQMPKFWGVYVAHDTAVALNATAGNHVLSYERVQLQTV